MNIQELREQADSGSKVSQTLLGLCYLYGVDIEIDYEEAFRLLSSAGTSRAVANLAKMYLEGLGVSQDFAAAIRLYKSVARFEFRAQLELGRIYSRGIGVQPNRAEALKWYSAAALADDNWVADSVTAAFVGSGTSDEIQEAKSYVMNSIT